MGTHEAHRGLGVESIRDDYGRNSSTAQLVLTIGAGDCTEHSLLAQGLLRAAGVPAREVAGVIYGGPKQPAFIPHAWVEVWIGRWIPVDPTWNQVPASVTHVLFGGGDDLRVLSHKGMRAEVIGKE